MILKNKKQFCQYKTSCQCNCSDRGYTLLLVWYMLLVVSGGANTGRVNCPGLLCTHPIRSALSNRESGWGPSNSFLCPRVGPKWHINQFG